MTRPPRQRGETPPPSAADLQRNFDKLGQMIQGSEERTSDKIDRVEAQGNARQIVNVKAQAETAARIDALAETQARADRRSEEILATATRGYRSLEQAQTETKEAFEARIKQLEERTPPAAAELAEHVVEANRGDNRRIAGLIAVGSGGTLLGVMFWGSVNFVSNHTKLVVSILHGIGFGLGKIPSPHE